MRATRALLSRVRAFPWLWVLAGAPAALAQPAALSPVQVTARAVFRELIGTNTDHDSGSTTVAAQAIARRLIAAGIPAADVQVVGPAESRNHNLVARVRGSGRRRPILLLAHLDVVTARRADWTVEPYSLTERDGFFYGRGASDVKDGAAILVAAVIQMKRDGVVPDRDVILALTAGEESNADYNGVSWLLDHRRDLIDAEFCWNVDGGDPQLQRGRRIARTVQASEKVYASFRLEATNAGGHSSLPTKDNAIYRLAAALSRLAAFDFPANLGEVTRAWFAAVAKTESAQPRADITTMLARGDPHGEARLARSPLYNAMMRTTCVATLLDGGHAENALPQRAGAVVNCRVLPGEALDAVRRTLQRVVADAGVNVTAVGVANPSPASPLRPEVVSAIEAATTSMWPGVPIVPVMETGATDGAFLRNAGVPTYGVATVFLDVDDQRAHGRDERILVKEFDSGAEYALALLKAFVTSR